KTIFWSFRAMVGSGSVMLLLGLLGIFLARRETLVKNTLYLKVMVFAIALPFIANSTGWIMTEMGRQPWVVFGKMKTEDAVSSSVTFNEVLFSLISFTAMYSILAIVTIFLFARHIKKNNHGEDAIEQTDDPFNKEGTNIVS